jgi:mannosyltransferase
MHSGEGATRCAKPGRIHLMSIELAARTPPNNTQAKRVTSSPPVPAWQKVWNVASSPWCSERLFTWALLVAALILGSHLRLFQLTRWDMSGDEGASWAAASASSMHDVMDAEEQLDPGKLAVYDVLLHGWIGVFGDSIFAMRMMSVALGIISLVLVFVAVREVCGALGDTSLGFGETAGAFAAFIYATNLTMVLSDRTIRMYPLLMAMELLQITFFAARSAAAA